MKKKDKGKGKGRRGKGKGRREKGEEGRKKEKREWKRKEKSKKAVIMSFHLPHNKKYNYLQETPVKP